MGEDNVFSDELRRELSGNAALGGVSPEELVRLAEARIREEADGIAQARGFVDADAVFAHVRDGVDEGGREKVDAALDRDFDLSYFKDLADRASVTRGAAAQEAAESAGGFGDHNSFVEASEKATSARLAGQPDHPLELKIARTTDAVIEGRDAGEGL